MYLIMVMIVTNAVKIIRVIENLIQKGLSFNRNIKLTTIPLINPGTSSFAILSARIINSIMSEYPFRAF